MEFGGWAGAWDCLVWYVPMEYGRGRGGLSSISVFCLDLSWWCCLLVWMSCMRVNGGYPWVGNSSVPVGCKEVVMWPRCRRMQYVTQACRFFKTTPTLYMIITAPCLGRSSSEAPRVGSKRQWAVYQRNLQRGMRGVWRRKFVGASPKATSRLCNSSTAIRGNTCRSSLLQRRICQLIRH